jgi:hypothetical protein
VLHHSAHQHSSYVELELAKAKKEALAITKQSAEKHAAEVRSRRRRRRRCCRLPWRVARAPASPLDSHVPRAVTTGGDI